MRLPQLGFVALATTPCTNAFQSSCHARHSHPFSLGTTTNPCHTSFAITTSRSRNNRLFFKDAPPFIDDDAVDDGPEDGDGGDDDRSAKLSSMARFIALRLGRSIIKSKAQAPPPIKTEKEKEETNERIATGLNDTLSQQETLAETQPSTNDGVQTVDSTPLETESDEPVTLISESERHGMEHEREGDRKLALTDEFTEEALEVEADETEGESSAVATDHATESAPAAETVSPVPVVVDIDPMQPQEQSIPDAISREYGVALEVLETQETPLKKRPKKSSATKTTAVDAASSTESASIATEATKENDLGNNDTTPLSAAMATVTDAVLDEPSPVLEPLACSNATLPTDQQSQEATIAVPLELEAASEQMMNETSSCANVEDRSNDSTALDGNDATNSSSAAQPAAPESSASHARPLAIKAELDALVGDSTDSADIPKDTSVSAAATDNSSSKVENGPSNQTGAAASATLDDIPGAIADKVTSNDTKLAASSELSSAPDTALNITVATPTMLNATLLPAAMNNTNNSVARGNDIHEEASAGDESFDSAPASSEPSDSSDSKAVNDAASDSGFPSASTLPDVAVVGGSSGSMLPASTSELTASASVEPQDLMINATTTGSRTSSPAHNAELAFTLLPETGSQLLPKTLDLPKQGIHAPGNETEKILIPQHDSNQTDAAASGQGTAILSTRMANLLLDKTSMIASTEDSELQDGLVVNGQVSKFMSSSAPFGVKKLAAMSELSDTKSKFLESNEKFSGIMLTTSLNSPAPLDTKGCDSTMRNKSSAINSDAHAPKRTYSPSGVDNMPESTAGDSGCVNAAFSKSSLPHATIFKADTAGESTINTEVPDNRDILAMSNDSLSRPRQSYMPFGHKPKAVNPGLINHLGNVPCLVDDATSSDYGASLPATHSHTQTTNSPELPVLTNETSGVLSNGTHDSSMVCKDNLDSHETRSDGSANSLSNSESKSLVMVSTILPEKSHSLSSAERGVSALGVSSDQTVSHGASYQIAKTATQHYESRDKSDKIHRQSLTQSTAGSLPRISGPHSASALPVVASLPVYSSLTSSTPSRDPSRMSLSGSHRRHHPIATELGATKSQLTKQKEKAESHKAAIGQLKQELGFLSGKLDKTLRLASYLQLNSVKAELAGQQSVSARQKMEIEQLRLQIAELYSHLGTALDVTETTPEPSFTQPRDMKPKRLKEAIYSDASSSRVRFSPKRYWFSDPAKSTPGRSATNGSDTTMNVGVAEAYIPSNLGPRRYWPSGVSTNTTASIGGSESKLKLSASILTPSPISRGGPKESVSSAPRHNKTAATDQFSITAKPRQYWFSLAGSKKKGISHEVETRTAEDILQFPADPLKRARVKPKSEAGSTTTIDAEYADDLKAEPSINRDGNLSLEKLAATNASLLSLQLTGLERPAKQAGNADNESSGTFSSAHDKTVLPLELAASTDMLSTTSANGSSLVQTQAAVSEQSASPTQTELEGFPAPTSLPLNESITSLPAPALSVSMEPPQEGAIIGNEASTNSDETSSRLLHDDLSDAATHGLSDITMNPKQRSGIDYFGSMSGFAKPLRPFDQVNSIPFVTSTSWQADMAINTNSVLPKAKEAHSGPGGVGDYFISLSRSRPQYYRTTGTKSQSRRDVVGSGKPDSSVSADHTEVTRHNVREEHLKTITGADVNLLIDPLHSLAATNVSQSETVAHVDIGLRQGEGSINDIWTHGNSFKHGRDDSDSRQTGTLSRGNESATNMTRSLIVCQAINANHSASVTQSEPLARSVPPASGNVFVTGDDKAGPASARSKKEQPHVQTSGYNISLGLSPNLTAASTARNDSDVAGTRLWGTTADGANFTKLSSIVARNQSNPLENPDEDSLLSTRKSLAAASEEDNVVSAASRSMLSDKSELQTSKAFSKSHMNMTERVTDLDELLGLDQPSPLARTDTVASSALTEDYIRIMSQSTTNKAAVVPPSPVDGTDTMDDFIFTVPRKADDRTSKAVVRDCLKEGKSNYSSILGSRKTSILRVSDLATSITKLLPFRKPFAAVVQQPIPSDSLVCLVDCEASTDNQPPISADESAYKAHWLPFGENLPAWIYEETDSVASGRLSP